MNFAILFEICLAAFFVYTPGLNNALNFNYMRPALILSPIPFSLYMIASDEARKLFIRKSAWATEELTT
jgi:hypothetical protein